MNPNVRYFLLLSSIVCFALCGGALLVAAMTGVHLLGDYLFRGVDLNGFITAHPVWTASIVVGLCGVLPIAYAMRCEIRKVFCRDGHCPFGILEGCEMA